MSVGGTSTSRTALVSGGGIGGLAAAIALAQEGWQVTVLEQAAVFWEAGAGLLITPNGERALDALGVGDGVRSAGHRLRMAGIRGTDLRWVTKLPEDGRSVAGLGVHRQALHSVLLDAASTRSTLLPGARVTRIDTGDAGGARASLTWQDASGPHSREADLLVGADGAASVLRGAIAPDSRLEASGYSSWRAVVKDDTLAGDDALVWWGDGAEFSSPRISASHVSWQAIFKRAEGVAFDNDHARALELFADWPTSVRDLVAITDPEQVVRHDLYELADHPRTYVVGNTALLGDAAHPMLRRSAGHRTLRTHRHPCVPGPMWRTQPCGRRQTCVGRPPRVRRSPHQPHCTEPCGRRRARVPQPSHRMEPCGRRQPCVLRASSATIHAMHRRTHPTLGCAEVVLLHEHSDRGSASRWHGRVP